LQAWKGNKVRTGKLSVKRVESILSGKVKGRYFGDGAGCWLCVTRRDEAGKAVAASWVYRYMLLGKSHELGLGSVWDIGLDAARERARQFRVQVRVDRVDVVAAKRDAEAAEIAQAKLAQARRMTFAQAAEAFIAAKCAEWRNPKSLAAWRLTLLGHAAPIGALPVADVDTPDIVSVLLPLWQKTPETASRLRGRIESVLDWAAVVGYRQKGDNPARWDGHLEHVLPRKSKIAPVEHHAALDWRQIGTFVSELRQQEGVAARALEFAILTWSRTGEVIGMRWDEYVAADKMWIIPGERMKAGKEHRVPLCGRALMIIDEMRTLRERRPSDYVFQGLKDGQPMSNMSMLMLLRRMGHPELTTHGFRASARTWAAEQTNYPHELAELMLAHVQGDKTAAAYSRGDGLAKRRLMSEQWCKFCSSPSVEHTDNIVAISAG
jgi:integrase